MNERKHRQTLNRQSAQPVDFEGLQDEMLMSKYPLQVIVKINPNDVQVRAWDESEVTVLRNFPQVP